MVVALRQINALVMQDTQALSVMYCALDSQVHLREHALEEEDVLYPMFALVYLVFLENNVKFLRALELAQQIQMFVVEKEFA